MKTTAIFSISTTNFFANAHVSLESFVEHCDYRSDIDIFNISLSDILDNKYYTNTIINQMCSRYKNNSDALRWSLKSALILYFLKDKNYKNVIYIDNDIYFVNNNTFLIDDLDKGILLTKHNRPIVPKINFFDITDERIKYTNTNTDYFYYEQFLCNFTDGFFNAGFIGASQPGIPAITWWTKMNFWQCVKSFKNGLYVDQKYLDVLALEFSDVVRICDHPGCNLAIWNSQTSKRSFDANHKWKINDRYNPIFCHFSTLNNKIKDDMLSEYYDEYNNKIQLFKNKFI